VITKNQEDYLRAIFQLIEKNGEEVKSKDIVSFLNISKPAVSEMLEKLSKKKYIKKSPYSNIFLTKKGLEEAKKIVYKHRVVEFFLKKILNLDKKKMKLEAHKLEHAMSDDIAKRLSKFLKNPKSCPCGYEIPNIN